GVIHGTISDAIMVRMFNVARVAGRWRAQKLFHHLASHKERMTMFARVLRDDRPNSPVPRGEFLNQNGQRAGLRRWPIDQRDHGGVTSAVQHIAQSGLQRGELPEFRIGVANQKSAATFYNWP